VEHEHGATAVAKRPRLDMAEIFRAKGAAFRRSHILTQVQSKAFNAIRLCRTADLGGHKDVCDTCGYTEISFNSCRNRQCPKCGALAQAKWIEGRLERLLPVTYFHVVFTLPSGLAPLAERAPVAFYDLLFASASATLLELGRDSKRLGAQLGATLVLHTWTRDLRLHPHIHAIVMGGGLSEDGSRWVHAQAEGRYLFPQNVLSRLFRGKFLVGLERAFARGELRMDPSDPLERSYFESLVHSAWELEWVVYAKRPFGGPEQIIRYLGRYTHRVAISNQRLEAIDDDTVTFHTRDGNKRTLTHETFLERFLLHVLPSGFVKIRHYGLLASRNATTKLELARERLATQGAPTLALASRVDETWRDFYERLTGRDLGRCPRCKVGHMVREELTREQCRELVAAAERTGKGADP
jgi:hypothetical protein